MIGVPFVKLIGLLQFEDETHQNFLQPELNHHFVNTSKESYKMMVQKFKEILNQTDQNESSAMPHMVYNTIHCVFFDVNSNDSGSVISKGERIVNVFKPTVDISNMKFSFTDNAKVTELVTEKIFKHANDHQQPFSCFKDIVQSNKKSLGNTRLGIIDGMHRCAAMLETILSRQEELADLNVFEKFFCDIQLFVKKENIENRRDPEELCSTLSCHSEYIMESLTGGLTHSFEDALVQCLRFIKDDSRYIAQANFLDLKTFVKADKIDEETFIEKAMMEQIPKLHSLCMQAKDYQNLIEPNVTFDPKKYVTTTHAKLANDRIQQVVNLQKVSSTIVQASSNIGIKYQCYSVLRFLEAALLRKDSNISLLETISDLSRIEGKPLITIRTICVIRNLAAFLYIKYVGTFKVPPKLFTKKAEGRIVQPLFILNLVNGVKY